MFGIAPTDTGWFMFLRDKNDFSEINFWTPTPWNIKRLKQGEKLYFMLKSPIRKIGGYGTFAYYKNMSCKEAWSTFGQGNGVASLAELIMKASKYVSKNSNVATFSENPTIGCIVLKSPVFMDDNQFVVPESLGLSFPTQVVKMKYFENEDFMPLQKNISPSILGFSEFPYETHSWRVLSMSTFVKKMDKSCFQYHGSGIPQDIKQFFGIENLKAGEKKSVCLVHSGIEYEAYFTLDRQPSPRARLFWHSSFTSMLQQRLPEWARYFKDNDSADDPPLLRLQRKENNSYEVEILDPQSIALDVEDAIDEPILEGAVKYYFSKVYERKPENRRKAIEIHGLQCRICGFDFEKHYGELGVGFIEIHHCKPLSTIGEEVLVDPVTDLIPLCSNCHRMIHRNRDELLTIEDMRDIYKSQKYPKANIQNNKQENCIFCRLASSKALILENDYAFVIVDKNPVTEGHSLIIPKRHFADYFDITANEQEAINDLIRVRRKQLLDIDNSIQGFNVGVNTGEVAGQTILHCHIHLIPRRVGDIENPRGGVRGVIPEKMGY